MKCGTKNKSMFQLWVELHDAKPEYLTTNLNTLSYLVEMTFLLEFHFDDFRNNFKLTLTIYSSMENFMMRRMLTIFKRIRDLEQTSFLRKVMFANCNHMS